MTEFGPGAFSMGPEHAVAKAGSVGRPNFFVEARVVGEDGGDVASGAVGELLLRGPSMFSGYVGQVEVPITADGWLRTGDLARVDEDGFYFIAGRKKEMFISGGENVYPLEIEQALAAHSAVAACAVVGVPDPRWGEVGRAFVVLRPGARATEAELLEHLRGRIARYKVPKSLSFRETLPRTAAGKVMRRVLSEERA
jgi:fatty-acyl-CoA synthase